MWPTYPSSLDVERRIKIVVRWSNVWADSAILDQYAAPRNSGFLLGHRFLKKLLQLGSYCPGQISQN